jgi:RimJ/RimL family protein N-acetyltransferase
MGEHERELAIRPLRPEQIRQFLAWRYPPPYDLYNMDSEDVAADVAFFSDPANGYFAIVDEAAGGELVGFCNFGADARVPGGEYDDEAVDVGVGMRPDLTGKGRGELYTAVVLEFAARQYAGQRQRVTVAAFNRRARRVCERHGFHRTARFQNPAGRPFVIMERPAPR